MRSAPAARSLVFTTENPPVSSARVRAPTVSWTDSSNRILRKREGSGMLVASATEGDPPELERPRALTK